MELKSESKLANTDGVEFKLYLYGIEMTQQNIIKMGYDSSNCTFMELKLSRTTRNIT